MNSDSNLDSTHPSGGSREGERPSVPILRVEDTSSDLEAIRTWQEAVSDALLDEVPHDLFALWLYPVGGRPVLIGPEALAQDNLTVPFPSPYLNPEQLNHLEEIVRDAGYGSVRTFAIRYGAGDVGLMLIADLRQDQYGLVQEQALQAAARAMAPVMGRIARRWVAVEPQEAEETVPGSGLGEGGLYGVSHLTALYRGLGEACTGAGTPRDFTLAVSYALQTLLPHDYIDVLIPDASGEQSYRLGGHGMGPLWADPALVVNSATLDLNGLFAASLLLLRDAAEDPRGPLPLSIHVQGPEGESRSVIGVRLRVLERTVGYLLLGSPGPDFYQRDDLLLLDQVGALIAARVEALVLEWQQQVLRSHLSVLRHVPMHLSRIAEILASVPLLGEGTRQFVQQASALLPLDRLEFALRLSDETRLAIAKPADATPLADLPQTPIAGTAVARVIRGEAAYLLTTDSSGPQSVSVLVVPLRVAGFVFGALAMTATGSDQFSRTDMAVAQQLADLIAPHFEVLRRTALAPPPFVPGWKRQSRF